MNKLSIVPGDIRPDLIREETLPDLFRQTVANFPDKTALIFHDETLTYAELNKWSDQIAAYIKSKGFGRNCYIGVWWQRGFDLHAIILGIVKAGATYVPVDREIPAERVEVILQEVGAAACFSMQQLNVECPMLMEVGSRKSDPNSYRDGSRIPIAIGTEVRGRTSYSFDSMILTKDFRH